MLVSYLSITKERRNNMKYLKQFTIILLISFAGDLLHSVLPLPVPGSIYGIILLFILLQTKILPLESVKETGKFLVEIMPVMFIPAAVGLVESWEVIGSSWLSYIIVTIVTTFLVMGVAGVVTQLIVRKSQDKETDA